MDSVRDGRSIEHETTILAPPERVFAAFTEQAGLESWFVLRAEVDARAGGEFSFFWANQAVSGRFLDVSPPGTVVLAFDERPAANGETIVSVALTPVEGGTTVHFLQTGFGVGPDWDALYEGMSAGWPDALVDLKTWLETGMATPDGFRTG